MTLDQLIARNGSGPGGGQEAPNLANLSAISLP